MKDKDIGTHEPSNPLSRVMSRATISRCSTDQLLDRLSEADSIILTQAVRGNLSARRRQRKGVHEFRYRVLEELARRVAKGSGTQSDEVVGRLNDVDDGSHHRLEISSVSGEGTPESRPPGETLARMLAVLLSRKAYERYVQPVIADMQEEWKIARTAGHSRYAQWIAVRGHFLVIPGWLYALIASWLVKRFLT